MYDTSFNEMSWLGSRNRKEARVGCWRYDASVNYIDGASGSAWLGGTSWAWNGDGTIKDNVETRRLVVNGQWK